MDSQGDPVQRQLLSTLIAAVVIAGVGIAVVVGTPETARAGGTVTVGNSAELEAALAGTNGGTIELLPGTYDDLTIQGLDPATPLTVTSSDVSDPARIDGWVYVNESTNIRVTDLIVDPNSIAAFDGWHPAFLIADSAAITVDDLTIDGHIVADGEGVDPDTIQPGDPVHDAIDGYGYGTGLSVRFSTDVSVSDVEIFHVRAGMFLQNSERVTVARVHIHDVRGEGIDIEDQRDLVIEDSRFERFRPWRNTGSLDSDHADMIQYWGANGEWGFENVVIRNNVFLQTDGDWTQSVFGHLRTGDVSILSATGFEIHDNLIMNNHLLGISLGNVTGAEVHHNLLLPGPSYDNGANATDGIPKIHLSDDIPLSSGNAVYSNIVVASGWQDTPEQYFGDNITINDVGDNTYLGDVGNPDYFLDVLPAAHDPYTALTGLPNLAVSHAYQDAIGIGHGPRWLNLSGVRFVDIIGTPFEDEILWMEEAGITNGCEIDRFCPEDSVTRGQMAAFFVRALELPPGPDAGFTDASGSPFRDDINRLAAAGITQGCGGGQFCPDEAVTRGQMAAFFRRALDLTSAGSAGFSDTTGHLFESDIDRLAAAGITNGCAIGLYCPDNPIDRDEMAAFFFRAAGLPLWPVSAGS